MNRKASFIAPYTELFEVLKRYWRIYGGARALFLSPYLHISVIFLLLTTATWQAPEWWSQVFSILPNLIGFSLGGLAIFLGVGSERFRELISGKEGDDGEDSPFIEATATFTHFILIQVIALLLALVLSGLAAHKLICSAALCVAANNIGRFLLWGFAYLVFIYAIALAVATAISLFRVSEWFDDFISEERRKGDKGHKGDPR